MRVKYAERINSRVHASQPAVLPLCIIVYFSCITAASKEMGVQEEGEQEMEATSTNIQEGKLEHQPRYIKGETADTAVTSDNVEGGSGAVVGEGVEGDSGAVGEGVVGGSGALGEGVEGDSSAVGEGVVGDSGAVVGEGVEGDSGAVVGEGVDRGSGAVGEGVVGGSGAVGEGVVGGSSAVGEGVEGDSSAVGEDVEGDSGALGEGVEGDSGAFGEGVEGDSGALGEGVEGDSGAVGEGVEGSNSDTTGGEGVKGASGDVGEGVQSVEGGGGEEVAKSEEEVRLWAAVKANPAEFTSWTSLLQIVEQKVCMCMHVSLIPRRQCFLDFAESACSGTDNPIRLQIYRLSHDCKVLYTRTSIPVTTTLLQCIQCRVQCIYICPRRESCGLHVRCLKSSCGSIRTATATGRSTWTW